MKNVLGKLFSKKKEKSSEVKLGQYFNGGGDQFASIVDMVYEFHKLFQHPIEQQVSHELLHFRGKLIIEEAGEEGIVAAKEKDVKETLDAAADSLYVVAGAFIAIKDALVGIKLQPNQEQLGVEMFGMLRGKNVFEDFGYSFTEMNSLAEEMQRDGLSQQELVSLFVRLYRAFSMVAFCCSVARINTVELVGEIHRSNMSKLWSSDDKVRKDQVARCKYDVSDLAFRAAEGRDGYIGYRISDGKILKCPDYSDVNLQQFVEKFQAE